MRKIINETETRSVRDMNVILRNISNIIFSTIEFFLVIRILLKLLGASSNNVFVNFVYSTTNYFVTPFKGIVADISLNANNVFELSSIFAIIIVGFIGWIVMSLLSGGITHQTVETTESKEFLK